MRAHVTCALALGALGLLVTGCLDRDLKPLNPCTVSGVVENVSVTNVEQVDMLFMIDNSNSMTEEQASLAVELPNMMRVLATGDQDGDGARDFPPVKDLHVGVVSSDMGTGGFTVPTCGEPNFGDDGVLRTEGNTALPGCMATYPSFLTFRPDDPGADPEVFAQDFTCVAQMGTGGCGFEQQLEAVLKALTPSDEPIVFNMGTTGHGDRDNDGFLRDNSLLAIILLTDEEDCSAADPELFNTTTAVYEGNLNLRCFTYPAAVHPVERYVNGLLALRDNPDLLVYAAIAGVPTDLVQNPDAISYDAILADERMREKVDDTDPNRLEPSCQVPGRGVAFPPRRIVTVAQQLENAGANAVVQSICQEDFGPALQAIIDKIANVLGGACLPRDLIPGEDGTVGCDVIEVLPATGENSTCDAIAGRELLRTDGDRQVCRVTQLSRNDVSDANGDGTIDTSEAPEAGWFYDDFTTSTTMNCGSDGQRITYVVGAEPKTGTDVRLECLQPVQQVPGAGAGTITIGSSCAGDTSVCGGAGGAVGALVCDTATNTCQKGCGSDADCSAASLAGWRCSPAGFCQNPTCG